MFLSSHRCIAPAVVFSNGSPNGHTFACLTVLFTYAHVHTEVRYTHRDTFYKLITNTTHLLTAENMEIQVQTYAEKSTDIHR